MGVIKAVIFLSSTSIVENESAVVNHIKESQLLIKNQMSSSTQAPPSSNLAASRGSPLFIQALDLLGTRLCLSRYLPSIKFSWPMFGILFTSSAVTRVTLISGLVKLISNSLSM